MHNKAGIAFGIARIALIIMDTVRIEGQGRVAKQQYWVGCQLSQLGTPVRIGQRCRLGRDRFAGLWEIPENEILTSGYAQAILREKYLLDRNKDQRSAFPFFGDNVRNF